MEWFTLKGVQAYMGQVLTVACQTQYCSPLKGADRLSFGIICRTIVYQSFQKGEKKRALTLTFFHRAL